MEGFEWKIVSSMEKVFPVREPSGEGVNLIPGQWRSLWVDLEAQDSSAPGVYPVSVRMVRNGECMGTAEMSFEILNADLPPLPIPHTEWFHSDCLAEYYQVEVFSEEYWRITENFSRQKKVQHDPDAGVYAASGYGGRRLQTSGTADRCGV